MQLHLHLANVRVLSTSDHEPEISVVGFRAFLCQVLEAGNTARAEFRVRHKPSGSVLQEVCVLTLNCYL